MKREETVLRKPWLDLWAGAITRVEPKTGATFGVPDVYLTWEGFACWVEFKVIDAEGWVTFERSQLIWAKANAAMLRNDALVCLLDWQGWQLIKYNDVIYNPVRQQIDRSLGVSYLWGAPPPSLRSACEAALG